MIQPIATLRNQTNSRVWSVDWHPKQPLLASVGEDKLITLWKQTSKGEFVKTESIVTEHLKTIRCVRFSNKGDKIAVCSFDSLISIYILNQSSYQFLTELQGHENQVKCISWHQNDKKIASCSRDKNVWIWGFNPTTYEYECENILQGHTNDVKFVQWIDYSTLVSCAYDDTIRVWTENDDDFQCLQELKCHQSIVWAVDYRQGYMMSVSSDFSVGLWSRNQDSGKFQLLKRIENVHEEPIYGGYIIYPYFFTCSGDNSIKLSRYEEKQGNEAKQITSVYHQNDVNAIRLTKHQNGLRMASCSDDGQIKIWNVKI